MSAKNQTVADFDENFFSSIAVPKTKDYSRLSSSPSRDQPCDSSYFEKHFPNIECDTPVKMRLPSANRESDDALPCPVMDNLLSSSSASENTTVSGEQRVSGETAPGVPTSVTQPTIAAPQREPLKIVPDVPASNTYGENQLIEGIEKLAMFAPKEPEERLSQRRRSEQKKKDDEEVKRRSINVDTAAANRRNIRSSSTQRSVSREPSSRAPSVARSRQNSVTRTVSVPIAPSSATGVVTRSMAARAADSTSSTASKPLVRRSVMPIKVAQKTPVAAAKDSSVLGGDRSRDRTRRTNTTGSTLSARRSALPGQKGAAGATTPVAPPRRSASANKTAASSATKVSAVRPIATANRSATLRLSAVKSTRPPVTQTNNKPENVRAPGAVPTAGSIRNRVPLRVNPATPTAGVRKAAVPTSGQRQQIRPPTVSTRSQSVERGKAPISAAGTPRQSNTKVSREDLFARLATPKSSATPSRTSHEGPTSNIRNSAVRAVPSYVHSFTKNGAIVRHGERTSDTRTHAH
uniref:Uncharacterized protein n=1 Tax=Caenorhabditis japonica TaxID=281687 RepID=A0A8R1IC05_CAEJA